MNLSKTSSSNDVTASTNCDVISVTSTPEVTSTNQNEAGSEVQNETTSPPTSPGRRISRAYLPPVPAFLKNMPAVSCLWSDKMESIYVSVTLSVLLLKQNNNEMSMSVHCKVLPNCDVSRHDSLYLYSFDVFTLYKMNIQCISWWNFRNLRRIT